MVNQRIVCAAIKYTNGTVILGIRHFDKIMHDTIQCKQLNTPRSLFDKNEQGFIDQHGNFLTRKEAWVIAVREKQIIRLVGNQTEESLLSDNVELFSENLY